LCKVRSCASEQNAFSVAMPRLYWMRNPEVINMALWITLLIEPMPRTHAGSRPEPTDFTPTELITESY